MEAKNRFRPIRVFILCFVGLVLLSVIILLVMGVMRFLREDREQRRRFENGEMAEYHNQPNNIYGAPIVYFRSDLERITGVRMQEKDVRFGRYKCKEYRIRHWDKDHIPTDYDHLTFYIFGREKQAKKTLSELKKSSFREVTDEGDNFVRGWLDGVVDADIERYYYINGNLMVVADVTVVDEMARPVDDDEPHFWGGGQEAVDTINMINDTF
jgi:hypothetical protein